MILCLILFLTEAVEMFHCQLDVPCEQRFFSCMALSVYEVIRVACLSCCLSRSWFVYSP